MKAIAPGSGVPTGEVSFFDNGIYLTTSPLVLGKARLPIASLSPGVHVITATYAGSSNYGPSAPTASLTQTIN